jgi:hypothetical protein
MEKHQSGKIHKNKQLCSQYQKELDEKQKLETLST